MMTAAWHGIFLVLAHMSLQQRKAGKGLTEQARLQGIAKYLWLQISLKALHQAKMERQEEDKHTPGC